MYTLPSVGIDTVTVIAFEKKKIPRHGKTPRIRAISIILSAKRYYCMVS